MLERATNQEQKEMIKKWWNNYGKSILLAVIIGVGLGYGWRYWQAYRQEQQLRAEMLYTEMSSAAMSGAPAKVWAKAAAELTTHYANTPYAVLADFWLAKLAVVAKQYPDAVKYLSNAVRIAGNDTLKQLAILRLARVYLASGQVQQAEMRVKTVLAPALAPLVDNVRGDVALAKGDKTKAAAYYLVSSKALANAHIKDELLSYKAALL